MSRRLSVRTLPPAALGALLAAAALVPVWGAQSATPTPLAINTARITIDGSSNVHEWTASTTDVRVVRAQAPRLTPGPDLWREIVEPGALVTFEIAVPAASLSSPKEGLDKNMHKALKAQEHSEITFRLARLEAGEGGALKGIGTLRIAGVEREIVLDLKAVPDGTTLAVTGRVALLMTDYGIKPPKAMLGMLKTDPNVTITFETVIAVPLT